jgi:ABC-type Fe2+-enterobactin transport system substrate-binding protein
MKTKLAITGIILALAAGLTPSAQATQPKTLVIIDSGFNTQLPFLAGKVIDEACFIEFGKCPNG